VEIKKCAHGRVEQAFLPLCCFLSLSSSRRPSAKKFLGRTQEGGQIGRRELGGEGLFARLLPFPFRLRKGKAEGGLGGIPLFLCEIRPNRKFGRLKTAICGILKPKEWLLTQYHRV
ncbi:MAG TPA: hypothetical protein VN420_03915, partial [Candidatus Fimivivens sp.]|nr:hypothetical protein [Candidatus Fimivivens sp.]